MSQPSPDPHARPNSSSSPPTGSLTGVDPARSWSAERIVITGGAGFVGSNLVRQSLLSGAQVTVLDDFSTGSMTNLPAEAPNLKIVRGSVADFACVRETLRDATIVLHAAARNIIVSTRDPREDYEVNIGGTLNVLLAVRESTSVRRTVYTSSASVYGNPRYLPINEDDQTNLLSPYSVSKVAIANYLQYMGRQRGFPVVNLRLYSVYGPLEDTSRLLPTLIKSAIGGELPPLVDARTSRDFIHVDDA